MTRKKKGFGITYVHRPVVSTTVQVCKSNFPTVSRSEKLFENNPMS